MNRDEYALYRKERDCPCAKRFIRLGPEPTEEPGTGCSTCHNTGEMRILVTMDQRRTCEEGLAHRVFEVAKIPCPSCHGPELMKLLSPERRFA